MSCTLLALLFKQSAYVNFFDQCDSIVVSSILKLRLVERLFLTGCMHYLEFTFDRRLRSSFCSRLGSETMRSRLMGPLPMFPDSADNYGLDSCSILCLHPFISRLRSWLSLLYSFAGLGGFALHYLAPVLFHQTKARCCWDSLIFIWIFLGMTRIKPWSGSKNHILLDSLRVITMRRHQVASLVL